MNVPARPGRSRPEVARAAEQALLPLRPLTLGEVLDVGFLVVVRNAGQAVALPLLVALAVGLGALGLRGLFEVLRASSHELVAWTVVVLLGLGLLLVGTCLLVWLMAVTCRSSLRTVLGPGFVAPSTRSDWRGGLRMLPAMSLFTVLSLLLAFAVANLSSVGALVSVPFTATGGDLGAAVGSVLGGVVVLGLTCWGYGYLLLAVPCYACESARAPRWIGRPQRETWLPVAFVRALTLVGLREALRATVLAAALLLLTWSAVLLVLLALLLVLVLYGEVLPLRVQDVEALLQHPVTWLVLACVLPVLAGCLLPFVASVQTIFYLDLRMRREGLDLAMRFDDLPVPQPRPAHPTVVPQTPAPPQVGGAGQPVPPPPVPPGVAR